MIHRRNYIKKSGIGKNFVISFLLLLATTWSYSQEHISGKVIFKLNAEYSGLKTEENQGLIIIQDNLKLIDNYKIERKFPSHNPPQEKTHISGQPLVDLSLIHELIVDETEDLDEIIKLLYQSGVVEYAEKYYIPELFSYTPNDPLTANQYYLFKIKAFEAWAISKGDTNQVIAIVDTGTDLFHADLINSIKYNYDDPINGTDSDYDGFIDNFHGWDLGEGDNNPQYNANSHGVLVCGLAAATPNNSTGIAGVGFNSKILPVKIDNENGRLTMAYEGIIYAADRGASVINLSWGGMLGAGQFGQDIINYAVLNRDIVVVAAAGNSNNQTPIYPASYKNAISVAATDNNDIKWSGSSFGINIDLAAPGSGVLTTWPNSTYNQGWGTSFASPIVAGAAAILRSYFPEYNALQIGAQMKVTTDYIDNLENNISYAGLLGTGRLNLYNALTITDKPYIQLVSFQHEDDYYNYAQPGDFVDIAAYFQNILSSAENVTAVLQTTSPYIELTQDETLLGSAPSFELINNINNPFVIKILNNYPPSYKSDFIIHYFSYGEYAGRETFSMVFNIDFLNISPNYISTTITSRGTIGYNYPNFNQGIGFQYSLSNRTLIKCAGFMIGNSTAKVVDNIYGAAEGSFNRFFMPELNAQHVDVPLNSDVEIIGRFNDSNAGTFQLNLDVEYSVKAWQTQPDDKYIIIEYDIINNSNETYSSLYAGFYADWIIQDIKNHRAAFDQETSMGYAYSATGGSYSGISLLSDLTPRHYAFDNYGYSGSLKISDGFTSFEKYTALKSNRNTAGLFDPNNDVSTLVSAGPFVVSPEDTVKVAFAILAGDHLSDLINSAQMARKKYRGDVDEDDDDDDDDDDDTFIISLNQDNTDDYVFISGTNPFKNSLQYTINVINPVSIRFIITDINGNNLYDFSTPILSIGEHPFEINTNTWSSSTYFLQLYTIQNVKTIKIIKH